MRALARGALCATLGSLVAVGACIDQSGAQRAIEAMLPSGVRPEVMPRLLNEQPPFVYPRALYDAGVPGDVLLRLWIDTLGVPVRDSTMVQERSSQAAFDSAAVTGAERLRFSPAMDGGHPVPVMVLLPVQFRRP